MGGVAAEAERMGKSRDWDGTEFPAWREPAQIEVGVKGGAGPSSAGGLGKAPGTTCLH